MSLGSPLLLLGLGLLPVCWLGEALTQLLPMLALTAWGGVGRCSEGLSLWLAGSHHL